MFGSSSAEKKGSPLQATSSNKGPCAVKPPSLFKATDNADARFLVSVTVN